MIISHKYNFIFVKTTKTAGTSIEIALSRFCGPDDVVTPISPEDEALRSRMGCVGPQNFLSPISSYGIGDVRKLVRKGKRKARFYNHIPAREAKKYLGDETWRSYFKFCVERNPWDRVVSYYYYRRHKSKARPSISEFVASDAILKLKETGRRLYTIGPEMAVDKVCRFEDLADELEAINSHLGFPEALQLPMAKSRFRTDRRSYRELLDEKSRTRISQVFADEIKQFGYRF